MTWPASAIQAGTEYVRRVNLALAAVELELANGCECRLTPEGALIECFPHRIETLLNGDA